MRVGPRGQGNGGPGQVPTDLWDAPTASGWSLGATQPNPPSSVAVCEAVRLSSCPSHTGGSSSSAHLKTPVLSMAEGQK